MDDFSGDYGLQAEDVYIEDHDMDEECPVCECRLIDCECPFEDIDDDGQPDEQQEWDDLYGYGPEYGDSDIDMGYDL